MRAYVRTAPFPRPHRYGGRMMSEWPGGVSDGLALNCIRCGQWPAFDYQVTDLCWERVVPKILQQDVICLPCLDSMAHAHGVDVSLALLHVQFTGIGKTVIMHPTWVHRYGDE